MNQEENKTQFLNNSIFWIEIDKIVPNPFQPRKEFDQARLNDLADSIRQYGILQPLVVTRKETVNEDGLSSYYELISGERRLRASKIAGLTQVPAIIRNGEDSDKEKLELAIIENLQREDLNAMDRAKAFRQLVKEFNMTHLEVGKKVGKSRVYVTNTIRLLDLPEEMQTALAEGKISEGHTRPLLMLIDKKAEQTTLFKEIMARKMTVREAELIARKIAFERARKFDENMTPEIAEMEHKLEERLGTRVTINKSKEGGKLVISFMSSEDLRGIVDVIEGQIKKMKISADSMINPIEETIKVDGQTVSANEEAPDATVEAKMDDRSSEEKKQDENTEELYNIKNFSL